MFTFYSDLVQDTFDHFYSKQEQIKTSEPMDTTYNKMYEQELLIYYFAI